MDINNLQYYKISIVTISYNRGYEIERTIESVINQTYENIEYIIIDGASTDNTIDIINNYRDHVDCLISEPDKGIYDAMNKGISHASGDYIMFINAGDALYDNNTITNFVAKIEPDAVIAYGTCICEKDRFSHLWTILEPDSLRDRMAMPHECCLIKLEYHKAHPYDTSFRSSGDYNFLHNAYCIDKIKFQHIPQTTVRFDCTHGMSTDNYMIAWEECNRINKTIKQPIYTLRKIQKFILFDIERLIKKFLSKDAIRRIDINSLRKQGIEIIENTDK